MAMVVRCPRCGDDGKLMTFFTGHAGVAHPVLCLDGLYRDAEVCLLRDEDRVAVAEQLAPKDRC